MSAIVQASALVPQAVSKHKSEQILFVGFNQDQGCFSVGTTHGFRIFNTFPFKDTFFREFDGGIGIVELLYRTNIIALVGGGEKPKWMPNKVMLWDDSQARVIGELNFKTAVKAVKMRKDKIVIALKNKVYVYNFHTLAVETKFDTVDNDNGLCVMNGSKEMCTLATPTAKTGQVQLIHFDKNGKTLNIDAHLSALSAMSLNHEGTLLATASEKGQVIRIFSTDNGNMIQELRRGTDTATVIGISFDLVSRYVGVTSDKGTIHVYTVRKDKGLDYMSQQQLSSLSQPVNVPLPQPGQAALQDQLQQQIASQQAQQPVTTVNQLSGYPTQIAPPVQSTSGSTPQELSQNPKSMFSFMRAFFPRYFNNEWSFAQFRIQDMHSLCCIRDRFVMAISMDGNYYVAEIDQHFGGDCKMISYRALIQE